MSDDTDDRRSVSTGIANGVSRRQLLSAAAVVGVAGGAASLVGAQDERGIELEGYTAGWEGVAPADIEGETNPTLSLEPGGDYTVTWTNGDGIGHNFNIEDADGNVLVESEFVSEEGGSTSVEFTASEEMAEYFCQPHPQSMRGDVQVESADDDTPEPTDTPEETDTPEDDDGGDGDGEEPTASVTFEDQTTDGSSVEVASVTMSEGGFVTIHDSRLSDGEALASVVGVSEYLEPGTHESVAVALDEAPDDGETLVAMPHLDTNDNQTYDFVDSEGEEDGPYTDAEGAVTDDATVTVEEDGEEPAQRGFHAHPEGEPHGVETEAAGRADFTVSKDGTEIQYVVDVENICNVTQAHIHLGGEGEDGPVVAWLYPEEGQEPELVEGRFSGTLAEGTLTGDDFVGEWEGTAVEDAVETFRNETSYVNVHTEEYPAGEIRGQIVPDHNDE